jgi:hypothetical protein
VLAVEAAAVRPGRHGVEDLRRDDHLLAGEEHPEQPPGRKLAASLRVHVGGVEEGDPALDRASEDRLGRFLVEHPRPAGSAAVVAHHPEAQAGDVQTAVAETHLIH